MSRMSLLLFALLAAALCAGCPHAARQQDPQEYQPGKQAEPQTYKEPTQLPPELQRKG